MQVIKASDKNSAQITRFDGWNNVLTRLGSKKGRIESTFYCGFLPLPQRVLTDLYMSDSLTRRVVNCLVDDAMRGFIDCEYELLKELQRVHTKKRIIEAATWARVYGGSILVAFVDDNRSLETPLNLNNIKRLISFKRYDRFQISWLLEDLSQDYSKEYYGEPEWFTIQPVDGLAFKVHRSRCHIFRGERTPENERIKNNYWDYSVIQVVYDALRNYGIMTRAAAEIIHDFTQTIISVEGLTNMIVQGQDANISARLDLLDRSRSVANTIILDANNESYTKQSSSVGGLSELWDRFSEGVSAATGIPLSKLFGRSAKGLNANMDNDIGNWNDIVDAYRGDEIEPCINWIIDIVKSQSMWEGEKPKTYDWKFPALKVPSVEEWANIKHKIAQVDQIYMDRGAVDPKYLFEKRYANGEFQPDIVIDFDEMNKQLDETLHDEALLEEMKKSAVNKDSEAKDDPDSLLRNQLYAKLMEVI